MANYLDELNEVQRQAVTHKDGPALVIAGPGSGKTRVLTYRIAHLVEQGAKPWEILALTFTNKAAREMKERIQKVVGDQAQSIWAGTFHSIFARILRSEAQKIGYPSNFTIYDTQDSRNVMSELVRSQGLDPKAYTASAVLSRISLAKNALISPASYKSDAQRLLEDKQAKRPYIYKLYDLYVKRCQRSGAMDFDDLLYQLHRLLDENPEQVREKYQKRFRYVLVDEFQDTNPLQYNIVQLLVKYPGSPDNICVVGDDAQSIYAFRGATIQNILDFEKDYPRLQVYKLEQNYRSTNHIVEAANEVILRNSKQLKKRIVSEKGSGEPIKVMRCTTDTEEAKRVAELIVEQKTRYHLKNEDVAILYRTNAQSRVFEEALKNFRIPYRIFGGLSFYDRKEVKDLIGYLRLIVNTNDDEALRRIINTPKRGIGKSSLEKLSAHAEQNAIPLWDTLHRLGETGLSARIATKIQDFVRLIRFFQSKLQVENADGLARLVARQTGMLKALKSEKTIEAMGRYENVMELLDSITAFVEEEEAVDGSVLEDKSLTSYLQNITLASDADQAEENDCVKLMSVHSAKGLEFRSVFVVGLEENIFPSFMAIKSPDPRSAIDEERRLFYVAITRAEEFLTLSYASSRYRYGKMQYNNSSRFLEEISSDNLDKSTAVMTSKVTGRSRKKKSNEDAGSGFSRLKKSSEVKPNKWLGNFEPSPISKVVPGARVEHIRFGMGRVVSISGTGESTIGTVLFDDEEAGEKRIMLKHAKLRVHRPRKNKRYEDR